MVTTKFFAASSPHRTAFAPRLRLGARAFLLHAVSVLLLMDYHHYVHRYDVHVHWAAAAVEGNPAPIPYHLTYGVLLPYNDRYAWSAAKVRYALDLAFRELDKRQYLPGWTVSAVYRDSKCSETAGPLGAVELYYGSNSSLVFLGPVCDFALAPVARFSRHWGVPVITAGALVKAFGNKQHYPMLTRVTGPYSKAGDFLVGILRHFRWEIVGFLFHNSVGRGQLPSRCYFVMEAVYSAVLRYARRKMWYQTFDQARVTGTEDYRVLLNRAKQYTRILIMCASPDSIREIMIAAQELHFHKGDFVFFNIDLFGREGLEKPWHRDGDSDERNSRAQAAWEALMTMTLQAPSSPEFHNFSLALKALASAQSHPQLYGEGQVNSFVGAFHDAVILYALALNESLEAGIPITNGSEITQRMWNRTFEGVTGTVGIDANGDRNANYCLYDYHKETDMTVAVAVYQSAEGRVEPSDVHNIHWGGDSEEPPTDTPECGFNGSKCSKDGIPEYFLVHLILFAIFLLALVASFFAYRHIKTEAELVELNWRVNWNEIHYCRLPTDQHSARFPNPLTPFPGSLASLNTILSGDGGETNGTGRRPVLTKYKGSVVVVTELQFSTINITKDMLQEMRDLRELQSGYVARFVGICIDSPAPVMLVEYCSKGSLKNILENENMNLDWMFRISILQDIVKGLAYLHNTEIHSHGNLKSSTCVVDSHFLIKLSGFDLRHLRRHYPPDRDTRDDAWYRRQLWTAPELLRADQWPVGGTQAGDVYSLAIIVQEIVCRRGVFYLSDQRYTPQMIYDEVKAGRGKPELRPSLDVFDVPSDDLDPGQAHRLKLVIIQCWHEDIAKRPDAQLLKNMVKRLSRQQGVKDSLADSMLARMEHYAQNLEQMVAARTLDYLSEKQRAQDLLYSMLPVYVAQCLIRGQKVVAETFVMVTIYFSDICGFTALSAASTPMQVVTLLNDLYTMFDSILEHYDVYKVRVIGIFGGSTVKQAVEEAGKRLLRPEPTIKFNMLGRKGKHSFNILAANVKGTMVETIGDAYMVVSGLPERNGDRHARNVACMALHLLRDVTSFRIAHRPQDTLQLRMGVHSGSVVAGVVGLKMPRYCLFGDTVNTASRMESNGLPLKIHLSQQTKEILDHFGTFHLTLRGDIEMKGKGKQTTYWLEGERSPDLQP